MGLNRKWVLEGPQALRKGAGWEEGGRVGEEVGKSGLGWGHGPQSRDALAPGLSVEVLRSLDLRSLCGPGELSHVWSGTPMCISRQCALDNME